MPNDEQIPAGSVAGAGSTSQPPAPHQEPEKTPDVPPGTSPPTQPPDGNDTTTLDLTGDGKAPPPPPTPPVVVDNELDLDKQKPAASPPPAVEKISKIDADREGVRGDLARGLLWLLTLLIGGLLVFVGIGRVGAEVLTQSVFPSLVTLTGTALGFYFGSQSSKDAGTKP
jgi:hypothetical protein